MLIKRGRRTTPKRGARHFAVEREALCNLQHFNIVQLIDSGRSPSGGPFHVMLYENGHPIMRYCTTNRISLTQRLQFFTDICGALSHAHQQGICHGDLNASNVIICRHGTVAVPKLIDFGNSEIFRTEGFQKRFRRFRRWFFGVAPMRFQPGQLAYTSPDHIAKNRPSLDPRTDIYGMGVLLYHLLTGHPPIDPSNVNVSTFYGQVRHRRPLAPSQLLRSLKGWALRQQADLRQCKPAELVLAARALDPVVLRCIEKEKADRYVSIEELLTDISACLTLSHGVSYRRPSLRTVCKQTWRKYRILITVAASFLVGVIVGIIMMWL